jgi:hypothetical protein
LRKACLTLGLIPHLKGWEECHRLMTCNGLMDLYPDDLACYF